jgi:D-alanyl-lipoteichoic acid acyltransferase DltB (MBOAT superfamily)
MDVSGYTDIAARHLLRYDLMLNFDRPYRAQRVGLWQRWHLGVELFRDYLYSGSAVRGARYLTEPDVDLVAITCGAGRLGLRGACTAA